MSGHSFTDAQGCQSNDNSIDLGSCYKSVWFLWLLAPMGICTQGSHVKSLCREPRFLFAINLNTLHSPQASVRLGESQKGAIQQG